MLSKIKNSSDGEKEQPCNLGQDSVFRIKTLRERNSSTMDMKQFGKRKIEIET